MDALGIEKAHIVGMSMGGMIVQVAAAEYPDRLLSATSIMSGTGAAGLPQPSEEVMKALVDVVTILAFLMSLTMSQWIAESFPPPLSL